MQRLGVVGRVVWFRFFVRVVVGRGCVCGSLSVFCAASRSALRDPHAVALLSVSCCGIRPRLRHLACRAVVPPAVALLSVSLHHLARHCTT